jgi:hypothetical protein
MKLMIIKQYFIGLPFLENLVKSIESSKVHGVALVEFLYKTSIACAAPVIKEALNWFASCVL